MVDSLYSFNTESDFLEEDIGQLVIDLDAKPNICSNSDIDQGYSIQSASPNSLKLTISVPQTSQSNTNMAFNNSDDDNCSSGNEVEPLLSSSSSCGTLAATQTTDSNSQAIPQNSETSASKSHKSSKHKSEKKSKKHKTPNSSKRKRLDLGIQVEPAGMQTEPEHLGPCEPGTHVNLEGVVWNESEEGVLVVNITWKGKSYVGTLLDCTRYDWGSQRVCDSPSAEDLRRTAVRAPKRNGRTTNNSIAAEVDYRSKSNSSSPATTLPNKIKTPPLFAVPEETTVVTSNGRPKRKSTNSHDNMFEEGKKRPRSTELNYFDCPEPACSKRYKNKNGLKYHQSHAHGRSFNEGDDSDPRDDTSECSTKSDECVDVRKKESSEEKCSDNEKVTEETAVTTSPATSSHSPSQEPPTSNPTNTIEKKIAKVIPQSHAVKPSSNKLKSSAVSPPLKPSSTPSPSQAESNPTNQFSAPSVFYPYPVDTMYPYPIDENQRKQLPPSQQQRLFIQQPYGMPGYMPQGQQGFEQWRPSSYNWPPTAFSTNPSLDVSSESREMVDANEQKDLNKSPYPAGSEKPFLSTNYMHFPQFSSHAYPGLMAAAAAARPPVAPVQPYSMSATLPTTVSSR